MNSSKLLCIVIGLQVLSLAGQYLGQPSLVSPVMAQMPDAGAQRAVMIEQLQGIRADVKAMAANSTATTARLDKIAALLEGGKLQVRVSSPDENKRPAGR
ncbi:MAG TPA: hypothetical protein VFE58_16995 [Tepidisphaeraceae bacterium]|jgi:ABC-type bacteriocin/lantibiotic exporter with double-glycine peptidase domain|nr:hypothetical protein [Tepidisphaeraceae bacterium]